MFSGELFIPASAAVMPSLTSVTSVVSVRPSERRPSSASTASLWWPSPSRMKMETLTWEPSLRVSSKPFLFQPSFTSHVIGARIFLIFLMASSFSGPWGGCRSPSQLHMGPWVLIAGLHVSNPTIDQYFDTEMSPLLKMRFSNVSLFFNLQSLFLIHHFEIIYFLIFLLLFQIIMCQI